MTAAFLKFAQKLTPTTWLAVVAIMLLLGLLSANSLYQHLDDRGKDQWVLAYESIGFFIRDTILLTFHRNEGRVVIELSDAVRIAPIGILDPKAELNWVTSFIDFVSSPEEERLPDALAPPRTLDPSWNP